MKIKVENGEIKINLCDAYLELSDQERSDFLELISFEHLIPAIERQLRHETMAWSCGSFRDGELLRAEILKINGIEPEYKKDFESRIQRLEREVNHYKKYYDYYFKIYHYDSGKSYGQEGLHDYVVRCVGKPEN